MNADGSPNLTGDQSVFVGRRTELARVTQFIDDIALAYNGVLMIEAEAGAGKTSIIRRAVAAAVSRSPLRVFTGEGDPSDARAMRCIADALGCRVTSEDPDRARIAQLLRSPRFDDAVHSSAAIQELVLDVVERESMCAPTLLVIDDLQWIDDASLQLIGTLLRRLRGTTFGVLAASRPSARVRAALAPLGVHELTLGPLADDDVAALAELLCGEPTTTTKLASLGPLRNNPFLLSVTASVRDRVGNAQAVRDGGESLRSFTLGLDSELRSFLELAAVGGREIDVDALAQASKRAVTDIVRLAQDATLGGWLETDGDDVTFRHDLLVEALISSLPLDRRDVLHRDLGRAFANLGHAPGRAAFHLDAAGYLLGFADTPLIRDVLDALPVDDPVALTLAERADELDPFNVDITCVLMKSLAVRHRHVEAGERAERWLAANPNHSSEGRVRLLALSSRVSTIGGDKVIAELEGLLNGDTFTRQQRAEALNTITRLHWHRRDASLVRSSATRALEASRAADSIPGEVRALCSLSEAASLLGEVEEALQMANVAESIAKSESIPTAGPALALGTALSVAGNMHQALPILTQSLRLAERTGDPQAMVLAQVTMQATRFHIGEWDAFVADADAMTEIGFDTGMRGGIVLPLGFAAAAEVRRGHFAGVPAIAARARAEFTMGDAHPGAIIGIGLVDIAELESIGRLAEASQKAAQFAALLAPAGASAQNLVLVDAARLAWEVEDFDALALAADMAAHAASVSRTSTRHCINDLLQALVHRNVETLVLAARAMAETERAWDGATSLHIAGMEARRTGLLQATALLSEAATRYVALRCDQHAEIAASGLGFHALHTPIAAAGRKTADPVALSGAEQKVLDLVIAGLPNGEIADALFVSKRTIESHLRSLYRKLGVTTRVALARSGKATQGSSK